MLNVTYNRKCSVHLTGRHSRSCYSLVWSVFQSVVKLENVLDVIQSTTGAGGECRSSWRAAEATALQYGECRSVEPFRLKYCSTCRRNRCCGPRRSRTLHNLQFRCPDNKLISERFMLIRSCECRATTNCPYTVQYDDEYDAAEDNVRV